jgi:hypothetical protein
LTGTAISPIDNDRSVTGSPITFSFNVTSLSAPATFYILATATSTDGPVGPFTGSATITVSSTGITSVEIPFDSIIINNTYDVTLSFYCDLAMTEISGSINGFSLCFSCGS